MRTGFRILAAGALCVGIAASVILWLPPTAVVFESKGEGPGPVSDRRLPDRSAMPDDAGLSGALRTILAERDAAIRSRLMTALIDSLRHLTPNQMLARADEIAELELRAVYVAAVLESLAATAPEAAFAYLETIAAAGSASGLAGLPAVPYALVRHDPDRALTLAAHYPEGARARLESLAIRTLAETDPAAALARLDGLPGRPASGALVHSIARAWARTDPDGALAWAESSRHGWPAAIGGVLLGIGEHDFDRAVAILMREIGSPGAATNEPALIAAAAGLAELNEVGRARLLGQLLGPDVDADFRGGALQAVVSAWGGNDTRAAMQWLIDNESRLESSLAARLAYTLAREVPDAARLLLDEAGAARTGWVAGMVAGMARSDPAAARRFLESYRGEPEFEAGMRELAGVWAGIDPARAANLLTEAGAAGASPGAVARIAAAWAGDDPDAAAAWLMGLPTGATRDAGLASVLLESAGRGDVDLGLAAAFSSDTARQQGMVNAVLVLGQRHPDAARQLMRAQITDPRLRRLTERELERTGGAGGPAPFFVF